MATISPVYDHFSAFEILESERERAIELLEKQNADNLTADESAELAQMVQLEELVSVLKARALVAKV